MTFKRYMVYGLENCQELSWQPHFFLHSQLCLKDAEKYCSDYEKAFPGRFKAFDIKVNNIPVTRVFVKGESHAR